MHAHKADDALRQALMRGACLCQARRNGHGTMDIGVLYQSRILDYHNPLGVRSDIPLGNMSLCAIDDRHYLVSVRQFNYSIDPASRRYGFFRGFLDERAYHAIVVDHDFAFIRRITIPDLSMYEDLRLMKFGNMIQASGTDISYGDRKYHVVCLGLRADGDMDSLSLARRYVFPVPHEKNYVPIEDGAGVFISDMLHGRIRIASVSDPSRKREQVCRGMVPYRGSSPLMRWRDGYVALIHRNKHGEYTNAFAFFDKELVQCRISDEFAVFANEGRINFACGMVIENDLAVIPFCVQDHITHLFRLPLYDFSKTARWRS